VNKKILFYHLLLVFFLAAHYNHSFAESIQLRWGLEQRRDVYFEKTRLAQNIAVDSPKTDLDLEKLPNQLRFFEQSWEGYADGFSRTRCENRHIQLWEQYNSENYPIERDAFTKFIRDHDPNCTDFYANLAPVLFFDFVASNNATHVLEKIEITTLGFEEYFGGGFVSKEAAYDIVLSHIKGNHVYKPDLRLRFDGTGRLLLRFWSDNYKPKYGWITPVGIYVIDITFVFLVNGKEVRVSTGPFAIDV
jgi:hypothetical protein